MTAFLAELRRRHVFRVAAAYLVVGWLVMQVVATISAAAGMPDWTDSFALILLVTGFPIVLFVAWAFELTPEGMKKTVTRAEAGAVSPLGMSDYVLIAGVLVVVSVVGFQALIPRTAQPGGQPVGHSVLTAGPVVPGSGNALPAAISDASIAVLPFADLSTNGDKQYFADGISEEILNVLARVDALEVTSRTSAFAFRSQSELSIPDIAEILRVRHVLEGSVRTAGGNIRITAQLIDAASDTHLWSQTYDHTLTAENVFAIQDEIANAITAQLTERLGIAAAQPDLVSRGTSELSAYEAYLEGRTLFINRNFENLPLAIAALEHAVDVDPDYASAWGVLAMAYVISPSWNFTGRDYSQLAQDATDRALTLDSSNADALTTRGVLYTGQTPPDWSASIATYEQAIAADPQATTAHLWLAQAWGELGFLDRSQAAINACLAVEPGYPVCLSQRAENDLLQGHYEAAKTHLLDVFATPHTAAYPAMLGGVARRGDTLLLTVMLREIADQISPNARWMVNDLRRSLSDEDYDRAAALHRFETRLAAFEGQGAYGDPYLMTAYLLAFRAYDQLASTDMRSTWWWAPGYPGLATSAARHTTMEAANLPGYWREHGYPPQCRPVPASDGGVDDFECD
jgi:adenylate cyclase